MHIKPFYVDNTTAGTPYEDAAASDLRSLIVEIAMEYSTIAMPISWLCLLYQLQPSSKLAMHLNEVKEETALCGIKEEVQMCLWVFHCLSVLLFFHNTENLKQYVFVDFDRFFQGIGKIYLVSSIAAYEKESKHLQQTGIVTDRLQSMLFEGEFIKGWSLRVLGSLGLCGSVKRGSNTAIIPNHIFVNSFSLPILPSMIEDTATSPPLKEFKTLPDSKLLSPLFFVFSPNKSIQYGLMQYTPPGFFTHLISRLTENYLFDIFINARDQSTTPSYNSQFKFSFEKLEINNVIIREHGDCIQVTVEQLVPENSSAECQPPEKFVLLL